MKDYAEIIERVRRFTKPEYDDEYKSDQQLLKPQPPLVKGPMGKKTIRLPDDFGSLSMRDSLLTLLAARASRRVFTGGEMSLLQLSFLLWATQGIKDIRGKNYATIRTVPCGGGRHEFESYFAALAVAGLERGLYHYLPMSGEIEFIGPLPEGRSVISDALAGQRWADRASVVFFWSMVPYRAEWRYGIYTHRIALVDLGHIGENMYLAAEALGLGTCGVGAFDRQKCDALLGLDGAEEYTVYTQPVGTFEPADAEREKRISIAIHDTETE